MRLLSILIAALLWVAPAHAWQVVGSGISTSTPAFSCSCTGDVTFCWEITANDTTITSSGGCSAGDTTATLNSAAALVSDPTSIKGGYVLSIPSTYDWVPFSVSSSDIFSYVEGTIQFDIYLTTIVANARVFSAVGLLNEDIIQITMNGNGTGMHLTYEAQNAGYISTYIANGGMSVNNWYTVTAKWRQGSTDPSLSINVNGNTSTLNTDLSPTTWTNPLTTIGFPDCTNLVGGNFFYVKNIKIWNTWQ